MELYYLPGSPFARVARVVALELAAPCTMVEDSGFPPKRVAAVNPAAQVPTLVDDGQTLFGTRLIAAYLMATYPRAGQVEAPAFAAAPTRADSHWRDAQILVALDSLLSALVARSYLIWGRPTSPTRPFPWTWRRTNWPAARACSTGWRARQRRTAFCRESSPCRTPG